MSDESPRVRSPLWIVGCMVLVAWVACGVYRREVPPLTTARAVLSVPSATDLGTLCLRPDIYQAAVERLEADGDIFIALEQKTKQPQLSGKLTATKLKSVPAASGPESTAPASGISTETWELTYSTPQSERAMGELHALISVIQPLVDPATSSGAADDERADSGVEQLVAKRQALQQELEKQAADAIPEGEGAIQLDTARDCVQSLQRALTAARVQRLQLEEEWRLVEQEVSLNQRLDAMAAKLSAGPIQEAVLQIDRQRKLSAELTRLNETERRLGNVYGEKHPKLVDLRQKFERVLSDLGGWDHVLDESHVAERVQTSLAQLMELKQQQEADLETQLELEKLELASLTQLTERRATLTSQVEQVDRELAQATQSAAAAQTQGLSAFAVQQNPEVVPLHWSGNLAFLFAIATAGGVLAGVVVHRFWSQPVYLEPDERYSPPAAAFVPVPETQLDLAQRRALRQARLQQAYAA